MSGFRTLIDLNAGSNMHREPCPPRYQILPDTTLLDILGVQRGVCGNVVCKGCLGFARRRSKSAALDAQLLCCLRCGCDAKDHRPLSPPLKLEPLGWPEPVPDIDSTPSSSSSPCKAREHDSKHHVRREPGVCWLLKNSGSSPFQLGDLISLPNGSGKFKELALVRELRLGTSDGATCRAVPLAIDACAGISDDIWLPVSDAKLLVETSCHPDVVEMFESEECFKDLVFQPAGLQPLASALRKRKCKICVLGGSISLQKGGYRPNLVKALERRGVAVEDLPAAVGTAGSKPLSLFVQDKIISKKPDLLIIEASVNDGDELLEHTPDPDMAGILRAAEGIVRTVRRKSPETVIVFLEMFLRDDTDAARVLKTGSEAWRDTPTEDAVGWHQYVAPRLHHHICVRYGLTQIDLIPAMRSLPTSTRQEWFRDDCHHSDLGGERLGNLIAKLILWGVRQSKTPLIPLSAPLMQPLDAQCWCNGRTMRIAAGWLLPPFTTHRDKDSLALGEQADWMLLGATGKVTIPFKGRACGLITLLGPDAPIVNFSVDGGALRKLSLLDPWCYYWRDAVVLICEGLPDRTHILELEVDAVPPSDVILKRPPKTPHWDAVKEEARRAGTPPQRLWLQYACAVEGESL